MVDKGWRGKREGREKEGRGNRRREEQKIDLKRIVKEEWEGMVRRGGEEEDWEEENGRGKRKRIDQRMGGEEESKREGREEEER